MRELKLRIYYKVYYMSKASYYENMAIIDLNNMDFLDYEHLIGSHIREQYTGRKDKNGKEIYEGDILATWNEDNYPDIDNWDFRDNPVIVKWSDKLNGWDFGGLMDDDEDSMYHEKYCGVIGNIHEEQAHAKFEKEI